MRFDYIVCAFLASLAFAVLLHAPKRATIPSALIAMTGWIVYAAAQLLIGSDIVACFIAAISITLLSEGAARSMKMPATIFATVGIIPIVPGASLYYSMFYLVKGNYYMSSQKLSYTLLIVAALAAGVALTSQAYRKVVKLLARAKPAR